MENENEINRFFALMFGVFGTIFGTSYLFYGFELLKIYFSPEQGHAIKVLCIGVLVISMSFSLYIQGLKKTN